MKFTLKCDIRPTLVGTGLVGTIFRTKSYSVNEKFLCKARERLQFIMYPVTHTRKKAAGLSGTWLLPIGTIGQLGR